MLVVRHSSVNNDAQTRMQIINPTSGGLYTGISNAASTIYRLEGLRTLWRGVSSVIVGAGEHRKAHTKIKV